MANKTVVIYLDKFITNEIDYLNEFYTNHPRGKIISIALSFYFIQSKKVQEDYLKKATELVKNSSQLDSGKEYGSRRIGKVRTSLYLREELLAEFKSENKKIVVLASLMYVGLIKS